MSGFAAELAIKIVGDAAGAVGALGSTGGAADGLMGKLKGFGPAGLAVGAAVAAGAVVAAKALYDIGGTWDDVGDGLRVKTGQTGDQLAATFDSVKAVASEIPAEIGAIGDVVGDVVQRMDLSGKTLETVSSQYLEAGRILGETVDVDKTSAAFNQFKLAGDEVVTGMDDLFRASQASGVSMNTIAGTVAKAGPALQTLGFSFSESATMAGALDKAGLNANATFAAMSKGMVTLAKTGEEPKAAFERVVGEIGGFVTAGDKAAALNLASKVFGTKGAAQFIGALESGTIGVEDLTGAAQLTSDTILGLGQETADAAEKWQILQNKALVALEPVGSAVFGLAGDALGSLMSALDGIDTSGFHDQLAVAGDALSGLGPVVDAVIALAVQLAPIFQAAFDTVVSIVGPALDLVAAIITTVTALIRGDWETAWSGCQDIVSSATALITSIVTGAMNLVKAIISALGLDRLFTSAWNAGKTAVSDGVIAVLKFFQALPGQVVDALAAFGEFLAGVIRTGWDTANTAVGDGIQAALRFFADLPGKIGDALAGLPSQLYSVGTAMMQGLINGVIAMASRVVGAAVGVVRNAIDAAKNLLGIASPSKVWRYIGEMSGAGLAGGLVAQIPVVAAAAVRLVNAALVDPPAISAPRLALDAPASSAEKLAGLAQLVINLTVKGDVLDPDQLVSKLRDGLNRAARIDGRTTLNGLVLT